jgi:mRNA interferase HicA
MKRRDLEKALRDLGWWPLRSRGKHDVWTDGENVVAVPRHREINELTAKGILRKAKGESK